MAETRKALLKSAVVATVSAILLASTIYYFFVPQRGLVANPLGLGAVTQFSSDDYSILNVDWLMLDAAFSNGSEITMSLLSSGSSSAVSVAQDYIWEFNATGLKAVILSVHDFDADVEMDKMIIRALVAFRRDRIINVTLTDETKRVTDLGSSQAFGFVKTIQAGRFDFNQGYYQAILDQLQTSLNVTKRQACGGGYWRIVDYVWRVNIDKLANVLQGTGMAQIDFALDVSMELRFGLFRTTGENLTGGTSLRWTGTWGTLRMTHEEGNITWIEYKITPVALVMGQPNRI